MIAQHPTPQKAGKQKRTKIKLWDPLEKCLQFPTLCSAPGKGSPSKAKLLLLREEGQARKATYQQAPGQERAPQLQHTPLVLTSAASIRAAQPPFTLTPFPMVSVKESTMTFCSRGKEESGKGRELETPGPDPSPPADVPKTSPCLPQADKARGRL